MDRAVLEKIQEAKISDTDDENYIEDDIREFLDGLSFDYERDVKSLENLSDKEFVKLYFYLSFPNNFLDVLENVEKYQEYFERKNRSILKVLVYYFNDEKLRDIMQKYAGYLNYGEIIALSCKIAKVAYRLRLEVFAINKVVKLIFQKKKVALAELTFFEGINVEKLISLLNAFDLLTDNRDRRDANDVYTNGKIKLLLDFIYDRNALIIRDKTKRVRNINRHNQRLDNLINHLDTDEEINDIGSILKLCPSEELKSLVLDYVIKHNNACYEQLLDNVAKIQVNMEQDKEFMFNKYGYSLKGCASEQKQRINAMPNEEVEQILKWLRKCNFPLNLECFSLIEMEKVRIVDELLSSNVISRKFVFKHMALIYKNNKELSLIVSNIALLNNSGINMMNYGNSLEILLSDIVASNLMILQSYDLKVTRDTKAIVFLKDKRLEEKIELIIEMGLLGQMGNLDILNLSFEELYRRKVFRLLGIPKETKVDFYCHEDYYVDSSMFVDEESRVILNKDGTSMGLLPACLLDYKISDKVLFINGVFVAVGRMLRNLSKFEEVNNVNIYYSIIYGAYYSLVEIEMLKEALGLREDLLVR